MIDVAQLFLGWDMFKPKATEKIKTGNFTFNNFFLKSCRLWDNVEKQVEAGQTT